MRNLLKKSVQFIWGSSQEAAKLSPEMMRRVPALDVEDAEIPRYPPFAKGLPATDVDRVISTQGELIERIRYALGINHKEFNILLLPVLENYASFVHLLPASESHHHRGAGGLFRHGLEAAFAAAQASDGVIFAIDGTPRERRDNEPRWRLVSTIAGLLHDVGKPLSDMSITNKDGTVTWNPYTEFLYDWAQRNKVDRYFLRWRDRRHKRHEQFSLLTVDRIIPAATREYIAEPGPKIMEALLEAVSGTSISNPVTKLMMFADKESVQRDLKQSRLNVDEFAYGVPVERYVFDAIRRLVNSGRWTVNEKGAKVWYLNQGVFIAWKSIGDLYAIIDQDNIPGIPRDPDTLADILIERGFAIQNKVTEEGGEATYRYWDVKPDELGISVLMLRFDSHELVFTSEPPAPAAGEVNGKRDDGGIESLPRKQNAKVAPGSETQDQAEDAQLDSPATQGEADIEHLAEGAADDKDVGVSPEQAEQIQAQADSIMGSIGMGDLSMFGAALEEQPAAGPAQEANEVSDSAKEMPPGQGVDEIMPAPTGSADVTGEAQGAQQPVAALKGASTKKESDPFASIGSRLGVSKAKQPAQMKSAPKIAPPMPQPAHGVLAPEAQEKTVETSPGVTNAVQALTRALEQFGDAGAALKALLLPSVSSGGKKGPAKLIENKLVVAYPEGVRSAGKTGAVVNDLADCGVLVLDEQGKRVWSLGGMRCIVLSKVVQLAYEEAVAFVGTGSTAEVASTPAPASTVPAQQTKPRSIGLPGTPKTPVAPTSQSKPLWQPAAKAKPKKASPGQSVQNKAAVTNQGVQKVSATATESTRQAQGASKKSKQNTTTARAPAPRPELAQANKPVVQPEQEVRPAPAYVAATFNSAVPKASLDGITPVPMTAKSAVVALLAMIEKGEGKWLVGPVTKENGTLKTRAEALVMIQQEHMSLSINALRRALRDIDVSVQDKQIVLRID